MGPLLARPEEREREMAAQAQEARERIAEPTALLDGFDTAAEKFRITRKTLLELPDPSLPVPPERCTRWWVGPVGLLPCGAGVPTGEATSVPSTPAPVRSAPTISSKPHTRSRGRPASRELEKCSGAASVAACVSSCSWSLP